MKCNKCGKDYFKIIHNNKGERVPDAHSYKNNDFHQEIRVGMEIYECEICGTFKKILRG